MSFSLHASLIDSVINDSVKKNSTVSMSNWLFEKLCCQIITGELNPDSRITEDKLTKSLDVSRTPLREALKQLEDVGLIVRHRNRTIRIAPLCLDDVIEMTKLRERLEGLIAATATEQVLLKKATTEKLHSILAEMERAQTSTTPAAINLKLGRLFHAELEAISGLQRVGKIMASLHLGLARYRHALAAEEARITPRAAEHKRILEAIESGDADEAEKQMRLHIQEGFEVFTARLKDTLPVFSDNQ